jgi:peptidoglycan hydrolase-like protein with peptidoglycan-binding domain
MKTKRIVALSSAALLLSLQVLPFLGHATPEAQAETVEELPTGDAITEACANGTLEGEGMGFTATGYYSPLKPVGSPELQYETDPIRQQGQNYYVNGSFEDETRMNGNGTNGASGAEVYFGMVAAPPEYAFGTKICLVELGWLVTVDDRGGAIKNNRIDLWTGWGDLGLSYALGVGKRDLTGIVLGIDPTIPSYVNLDMIPQSNISGLYPAAYDNEVTPAYTYTAPSLTFENDLFLGDEGAEVSNMQDHLLNWGYELETTGFFGEVTMEALINFQMHMDIIDTPYDFGAGNFGPTTRQIFEDLIKSDDPLRDIMINKGETAILQYPDLYEEQVNFSSALQLGDSGQDVVALQQLLTELGYFRAEINGYYGSVTENAVMRLQLKEGIIDSEADSGAGYVGPKTRSFLNEVAQERYEFKLAMAAQRSDLEDERDEPSFVNEDVALPTKEEQ